jgi:hypothetical protein
MTVAVFIIYFAILAVVNLLLVRRQDTPYTN